ncbi:MAG: hypothetical protein ACXW31_03455 [Thermoanaerobaculia bacterium]
MKFSMLDSLAVIHVREEGRMLSALPTVLHTHSYTRPDNRLDAVDDLNDATTEPTAEPYK